MCNVEGRVVKLLRIGFLAVEDGALIRKCELDGGGDPIPKDPPPQHITCPSGCWKLQALLLHSHTLTHRMDLQGRRDAAVLGVCHLPEPPAVQRSH